MNKIDSFIYNTVQIECTKTDGKTYYGTGFFVQFKSNKEDVEPIKLLLTNKHVVKDALSITIKLCTRNDDDTPDNQRHIPITITDPQNHIINHPDKKIDLCAIPNSVFKEKMNEEKAFATCFSINDFSPIEDMNLSAIEDVISLGYPRTQIDQYNNKPIVRKGITATHPALKYNGADEFLVDIACYQGCSGSPVFLYSPFINQQSSTKPEDTISIDYKIRLLGIICAVLAPITKGNITNLPDCESINKDKLPVTEVRVPIHLGYAININQIYVLLSEAARIIKSDT